MGVRVGVANFFWGQSIGIDETNTLGGLWALEWAWHLACAAQESQESECVRTVL